jgi:hypothetical protein
LSNAAHGLAALLSDWTDVAADQLFADNVALDESYERRAKRAAEMVAEHGSLAVTSMSAEAATRGRISMRHADGAERLVDMDIAPLVPPRIQFYEVVTG